MRSKIYNEIIERLQGDRWGYRIGYLVDEILDMPVDGVQVKNTTGTTKFVCPLTIGEALEMLPKMVEALKAAEPCLKDWIETTSFGEVCRRDKNALALSTKSLTAKDGGIVEVKND